MKMSWNHSFGRYAGFLDVPKLINGTNSKQQIIDYYRTNKISQLLYDRDRLLFHFGIGYYSKHKRSDFKEPARLVESYFSTVNADMST